MSILIWLAVGLVAGFLAGQVIKHGFGMIGTVIVGLLGGLVGGWLAGILGISNSLGLIGEILIAAVGAVVLLWIVSMIKKA